MAPGFSRLFVSGYRRLKSVDLPLGAMNILIGTNGVGKSSLLDILDLLAASAAGELDTAIAGAGGLASLLTADRRTTALSLAIVQPAQGAEALHYQLKLVSQGYGYAIDYEALSCQGGAGSLPVRHIEATGARIRYFDGRGFVEPDWEPKWQQTSLSQVPRSYRDTETFRRALADVSDIYHTLDVSPRARVRMPQPLAPADTPGAEGEDLLPCLFRIKEEAPGQFEAIEDALRAAYPSFERLELRVPSNGLLTLGWRDRNFTRAIFANELSEGTLRFLWLVTLLQSPSLPRVLLIDEPEVSLHPGLLRLLAELMREASSRTQIIVATHSDRLVRFLQPDELVVCDHDETGGMTARRAEDLDLSAWMHDYALDELWSMGRLGGR